MACKHYPIFLLFLIFLMAECASKKQDGYGGDAENADENEWKEMDQFHIIMAETFHPYMDSANLEPAKSQASALLRAADEWAAAPLPDRMDNEQVKTTLQKLRAEAATLAENVRVADDQLIAAQLTRLHDTFHELQEAWYGGH
jgi:hypothetical protein